MHRAILLGVGLLAFGIVQTSATIPAITCPTGNFSDASKKSAYLAFIVQSSPLKLNQLQSQKERDDTKFRSNMLRGTGNLTPADCLELAWGERGERITTASNTTKRMWNYICHPRISISQ